MIARNPGRGNGAGPSGGRVPASQAADDSRPWEGKLPKWLRKAAAEGRRAGKFPQTWSTSNFGILDGIRELSEGLHLVDRWGCENDRLIFEAYIDRSQAMQRLLQIADALGCWVAIDPEGSRSGRRPAGQRWSALGYLTRIEFGRVVPGSHSHRYFRYPLVQLASGARVHIDERGLLVNGREPGGLPSRQDSDAICQWLKEVRAKPKPKPTTDMEVLQELGETLLGRPVSLGSAIMAAQQAGILINQWDQKYNPFDALIALQCSWLHDQIYRLREKQRQQQQRLSHV